MVERFRKWYEYEQDSHAKVLASLRTVPHDRRNDPQFEKAVQIFAHILVCRQLWLGRLNEVPEGRTDFFPPGVPLDELDTWNESVDREWTAYLNRINEVELSRTFRYRSTEGDNWRNTVEEALTQLFGHSWYHRGQIASLVAGCGGKPAATDLVYLTRRPD